MNIIFDKLVIENFMSFESVIIDFTKYNGYTLIKGINNCTYDNAVSNGSGKSTIWEALVWCLTGETIRGNKDVVRNGEDFCSVELYFYIDDNYYLVNRMKGSHSNLFIYINGENKSGKGIRDTEKLLEQYLPDLTSQLINSTIILGQGLPARFTNNTPAGRKEVLETLSKSDYMIEDLKQRITDRSTQLSAELRTKQDELLSANTSKTVHTNAITTARNQLANLPDISEYMEDFDTVSIQRGSIEIQISQLTEDYNTLSNEESELNIELYSLVDEKTVKLTALQTAYQQDASRIDNEQKILDTKANIASLQMFITNAKSVKDVCPTCGQKLPNVHKIDTTKEEADLSLLNETLIELQNNSKRSLAVYNQAVEEINEAYMSREKTLQDKISNIKTKMLENTNTRASLSNQLRQLATKAQSLNEIITKYDANKASLEVQIESSNKEIEKLENEILYISKEIESLNNHIDVINKFSTIAKRDFRGYLLSNIIDYINAKAKEYCSYIFETNKINFALDGNNISISYCDKEYEALSGGEKQKIDLIVQFAIRDMLCKYLNFESNILVLDEITDNLDTKGCDKIIDFISNKLNINSIYIISHRAEALSIPYDQELVIIKDADGTSSIC